MCRFQSQSNGNRSFVQFVSAIVRSGKRSAGICFLQFLLKTSLLSNLRCLVATACQIDLGRLCAVVRGRLLAVGWNAAAELEGLLTTFQEEGLILEPNFPNRSKFAYCGALILLFEPSDKVPWLPSRKWKTLKFSPIYIPSLEAPTWLL